MKRWDWNDNDTKQTGAKKMGVTDWNYTELGPIRDWPPWTAALVRGRAEVLQVLIDDAGFVPRFFDFFKLLPTGYGYFDTIEGFETFKVLVRGRPKWEYHVEHQYAGILSWAIYDSIGNLEIVRFLVDSGCPVNYPELWGHTPLAYAADAGNVETVRFLLDRGADPDPVIPWPLRLAAEKGHVKVAELLLKRIDVRRKITSGNDQLWLLYSAAACGFEKIVRACLDAGCNADRRLFVRYFPFIHADESSGVGIIRRR
ncbi:unnamed protein product [Penicillium nalgiovense]|uniref:Uncharacterized protein n=1 Tax=Penicillium nalgiovense TaxID=60175 RepID=A0A9W4IFH6_PENNA|nr:unnamed protein product [Penicillium nalgiovense]CAG7999403.1 unnamed protein product [Penicillium nalgiovense]CAG8017883.1 unnamed protein product [Penicillium nalgiovense]CAG8030300.1 unnamed protein product [Penicillium nalgiovense]CAG8031349.1 unnamed protein product [Penicillium nalgiovense]